MAKLIAHSSILTANDTLSGRVVFWTGSSWSQSFDQALQCQEEDLAADLTAAEANVGLVGAYLVHLNAEGKPLALRERRRLAGVSVTPPQSKSQSASQMVDFTRDFKVAA